MSRGRYVDRTDPRKLPAPVPNPDTIGLTDTIARGLLKTKTVADTLNLTDSFKVAKSVTFKDVLGLSDNAGQTGGSSRYTRIVFPYPVDLGTTTMDIAVLEVGDTPESGDFLASTLTKVGRRYYVTVHLSVVAQPAGNYTIWYRRNTEPKHLCELVTT